MDIKLCSNYNAMKSKSDKKGYSIIEHIENGYSYASKFVKGDRYVWLICEGWQTADLIDGRFTNHFKFAQLDDAFNRGINK